MRAILIAAALLRGPKSESELVTIASALIEVDALAFIDALCNIRRLAVDGGENGAALVVKADFGVVVADAANGVLGDFAIVDVRFGRYLARDDVLAKIWLFG